MVEIALALGLNALVITDHNTAEGIEPLREAALRNGLIIFPGIEISARGGHVLALFDPEAEVELLRQFLQELGFSPEEQGRGYCETGWRIDQVFAAIEARGGLAIAAHVDRKPHGFIASEESVEEKQRAYLSQHLSALEITIPQDKTLWNRGQMPFYPRGRACIQGSDAHAPREIGRRVVYLDIPELSLSGLRLAFRQYNQCIRFPEEVEREALRCSSRHRRAEEH
jgi:hypothetical protein